MSEDTIMRVDRTKEGNVAVGLREDITALEVASIVGYLLKKLYEAGADPVDVIKIANHVGRKVT